MVERSTRRHPARLTLAVIGWTLLLMLVSGRSWGQTPEGKMEEKMFEYQSLTANVMVENVDATLDWWAQQFGFKADMTAPETAPYDWALAKAGGAEIMFQSRNSMKDEAARFADDNTGHGYLLFVQMQGVQALYDRIKDRVNIAKVPERTSYGALEFAAVDPNGIMVVFAEFGTE